MKTVSHRRQRELWEEEHKWPAVLPQMDSEEPSSGVQRFWSWFVQQHFPEDATGIEMGCGKGRNSIWLAQHGVTMVAFDFSPHAIEEAKRRARKAGIEKKITFLVHDAAQPWPFDSDHFDFAIDCFASTDIESPLMRAYARKEFWRILKKGGYLFVYTLSTDDEFHKEMVEKHPANERNSFIHPMTGKFEKIFDRQELLDFYKDFTIVKEERVEKETEFFGKTYQCNHFWLLLQRQ